VRAGAERDETGAIAAPLHLSTNFEHSPQGEPLHGYMYVRLDNPTQRRLEDALARLEEGQAALAFASGVAAGALMPNLCPRKVTSCLAMISFMASRLWH
jgi:cystathionine gamma-synthase